MTKNQIVTIDDEVAVMRRVPILAGIETRALRMLAAACRRAVFAAGQVVFRQGDHGDAAYVVLAGTAVVIDESSGVATPITTVGPNALVGELAIICGVARTATVKAETELVTLRIERDHFLALLRQSPEACIAVMQHIGLRLIERTRDASALRSAAQAGQR